MNFLSRKALKASFSSLYRTQFYSFVRNVKPRAPKLAEPESSTSKWTKASSIPDKKVVEDFLKNQNGVEESDQEVTVPQEEVFDHNKYLQAEIRRQRTLQAVFDYYNMKKSEMDLINICTCLNQAVNLYRDENNRKNENELAKKPEVVEMINHLKSHAHEMDNFTVSNFLSNIAKMNVLDRKTVDILVNKTLHNNIQLNEKPLTYITWTLGKLKINNPDFLNMVAKRITQSVTPWKAKSVTNVFWAMSELDYRNKAIFELMQTFILEKRHQFDPYDLNLIFNAYNNYRMANYDILDAISHSIIRNIQKMSFRSLANIANYCANLNYVNNMLMDQIEREIVKKLKKSPEFQNLLRKDGSQSGLLSTPEENTAAKVQEQAEEEVEAKTPEEKVKITGLDEKINLMDITQILVSFCKLKVIKSELFEILELYFIQNLDKASGASIVSYAFAHSALCNEMLQKYQANKKTFLKRSLKNLKKYNHTFYEVLIPFLDLKLPEFTPEEVFSLLVSASRPPVTKRVIRRGILEFAIAGIPKIAELRKTLTTIEFEKFIYKYNLMLQKYIDKNLYVPIIVEAFKSIDVNILLIDKAYSQILMVEEKPRRKAEEETFFEEEEEEDSDESASDSDHEEVAQTKKDQPEEGKKKRRRRGPKVIDLTEDVEEPAENVQKETKN